MSNLFEVFSYLNIPENTGQISQAQRLFHGRGHAYPGLNHITVDWLPPVLLITLYKAETLADIDVFADRLLALFPTCKSVQLQHRYQLSGPIDVIRGEAIAQFSIEENNLKFFIQLGQARNTGLFLDMKNGRQWVQQHSEGKRVLNLFSYTCGFSVAAIAGKAMAVLNVDMSRAALNVGRENHRLNHQSLEHVRFEKLNIFKSFGRLKRRGPFDLLICDPPTFQKGSVDIVKDYPKIMQRLEQFMAPGSALLLCLNAPELSQHYLLEQMARWAPIYKFMGQIKTPEVFLDIEDKGVKVLYFKCD